MRIKIEISAGGIVYKKMGNIYLWLVCQHSQHKGWIFPKGLVGDKVSGEPMAEAAIREVEEEGGIKAKIVYPKPIMIKYFYKWQDSLIKKTAYYFLMEYLSGDPEKHDLEILQAKFVTKEELQQTLTYNNEKKAFEEASVLFQKISGQ